MTAAEAVQAMIDRGLAMPVQSNVRGGYITYEFLGGMYDGVKMRLYPPFTREVTIHSQTWTWGPPKNKRSARLTYRLEE